MALTKFPIEYIEIAQNKEVRTLAMRTVHDIAFGISTLDKHKYKRNMHLWCYRTEALKGVEKWLEDLNVIGNPDFRSFANFELLYDFVLGAIGHIYGISSVEVYDVSLYLGERMAPQVVPSEYVYVHGKLIEAARHYLVHIGVSRNNLEPYYRIKTSNFGHIHKEMSDNPYTARAIEEWLCCEHDEIMKL